MSGPRSAKLAILLDMIYGKDGLVNEFGADVLEMTGITGNNISDVYRAMVAVAHFSGCEDAMFTKEVAHVALLWIKVNGFATKIGLQALLGPHGHTLYKVAVERSK